MAREAAAGVRRMGVRDSASVWSKLAGALIAVALVVAAMQAATNYQVYVLTLAVVFCVASFGMNVLAAYSGQLSMGNAAFFGIGAYAVGISVDKLNWPLAAGFLLGIVVAAVAGFIVGLPAARLSEIYLAIATLAFLLLFNQVTAIWKPVTGAAEGLPVHGQVLGPLDLGDSRTLLYVVLAAAMAILWVGNNIISARYGRAFLALKASEHAAASAGIDVMSHKLGASVLSAAMTGAAGCLYAVVVGYIEPAIFDVFLSVSLLTMVIVGGRGFVGSILGALFVTLLPEVIRLVGQSSSGRLVLGVGLLVALYLAPQGLAAVRWRRA